MQRAYIRDARDTVNLQAVAPVILRRRRRVHYVGELESPPRKLTGGFGRPLFFFGSKSGALPRDPGDLTGPGYVECRDPDLSFRALICLERNLKPLAEDDGIKTEE